MHQLGAAESQMGAIDSSRGEAQKELSSLRLEMARIKTINNKLESDTDELAVYRR